MFQTMDFFPFVENNNELLFRDHLILIKNWRDIDLHWDVCAQAIIQFEILVLLIQNFLMKNRRDLNENVLRRFLALKPMLFYILLPQQQNFLYLKNHCLRGENQQQYLS